MALSIDSNHQFGTLFSALPWQIMEHIFQYLPVDFISNVLLKAPSLRPFIIDKYYSRQVRLYLIDPNGKGAFDKFYKPSVSHFIGTKKIKKFFTENPDIVPRDYKIYPDIRYTRLEEVLQSFQGALSKAKRLDIIFPLAHHGYRHSRKDPSRELMDLIFSFRNLSSLEVWYEKGNFQLLPTSKSLVFLILSTYGNIDWSRISLPTNLYELNISNEPNFENAVTSDNEVDSNNDMESDSESNSDTEMDSHNEMDSDDGTNSDNRGDKITFEKLLGLLWNAPATIKPTADQARCPNLGILTLNNCGLDCLHLSLLPPTLSFLNVSCNYNMDRIEYNGLGPYWPKYLWSLSLDNNAIDDYMLSELSKIGWPTHLKTLDLSNNRIISLKHLFNLPETLTDLSLGHSEELKDLNFTRDDNGHRIANLPDSLETLKLDWCKNLTWGHFGDSEVLPIQERLHFPPKLKFLGMSYSNLKTIANFVFPPSLETLETENLP